MSSIKTIFGTFSAGSKKRLDLTFDYETCAIRSFKRIAKQLSASCFVDIGSNIGVYSIYLSDLTCIKEIHAFEPAPESYRMLAENVSLQENPAQIKVHQVALSAEEGEVNFHIVSPTSGANGIVEAAGDGTMVVQAKKLDTYLLVTGTVAVLKIDVEGHEVSAISGAKDFLTRNKCYLQIESLRPDLVSEIKKMLSALGYVYVFSLQNDHLFLHADLCESRQAIMEIIAEDLAKDLHDLTQLRLEKRSLAREARQLFQNAGYARDPLLIK